MKVFLVVHEDYDETEYYGAFTSAEDLVRSVESENEFEKERLLRYFKVYEMEGKNDLEFDDYHELDEYL